MKNFKKIAALAGVGLIVVLLCLSLIFALGEGEAAQALFRGTFAAAFILPILLYIFFMVYKVMNRGKENMPEDTAIKNVVFDIGKVLMSFEWEDFLKNMGYSGEKLQKIAQATFLSEVWQERDRGLLSEEEYVQQCVALAPEYEDDIRKVMKETPKSVKIYPYAETWVKYLKKKGYHLYIISNFSRYMAENNVKEMTFRKYMDGEIFSYEVNELKPDAVIFEMLMQKYILNPKECVMIDDRPENCAGARSIGMQAIEFKNFQQATEELAKLGVS